MTTLRNASAITALLVFAFGTPIAQAQVQTNVRSITLSGLMYMDYAYQFDNPAGENGDNGFTYRRVYLTSDFRLNDDMRVRARMEANDGSANDDGKPAPFIKDLYFRWDDVVGEGHRLTVGVTSPPSFGVSEGFLGYRSLEKTIQDRNKIVSSRDMGAKLSGPLAGAVNYALMVGNNSSVKSESNQHKRVYGQLAASPGERFQATLGFDYASLPGGNSVNTNAFLGYSLDQARIGVEGYMNPIRPSDPDAELDRTGISAFAAVTISEASELVARYDNFRIEDAAGESEDGWYGLIGLAWSPADNVQVIPNVVLDNKLGADDPSITGRLTLNVSF